MLRFLAVLARTPTSECTMHTSFSYNRLIDGLQESHLLQAYQRQLCVSFPLARRLLLLLNELRTDQGQSVDVTVVDRCPDCPGANLELSPAAFDALADPSLITLYNVQWNYD